VTVALVGVAAGLDLDGMLLTFQPGPIQDTAVAGVEVPIPFTSVLVTVVTLLPLAVLFGWIFLGVAAGSASFREAQNALTPVYILVLTLAMLTVFRGIDFGPLLAITPVAGVPFLFRGLITGGRALLSGSSCFPPPRVTQLARWGPWQPERLEASRRSSVAARVRQS
jgi:hypothetical protein